MIIYIIIILVGLIEAFCSTLNSKFRQKSNRTLTFITSFINIFVWYCLLRMVIENIANIYLALVYGIAYAMGDVLGLLFDSYLEKIAKFKGLKFRRKSSNKRKR